jgi:predicted nucleotidyltransferase
MTLVAEDSITPPAESQRPRIDPVEALAVNRHLETIKRVVLAGLQGEDVSVALFGSMASGFYRQPSDVDVAILPRNGWDRGKLALLREKLENLNVPYKVDVVDFSIVSQRFRDEALKTVVWWRH